MGNQKNFEDFPFDNEDSLLDCLVIMSQYYNKPYSRASLRAGLPLGDGLLTPRLFVRAAERAGLAARIVSRSIEKIPPLVLPVVLILKDGKACVLHKINSDSLEITLPEQSQGLVTKSLEDIKALYTGHAIYLHPLFQRAQHQDEHKEHPKDWFWGTLWKYKRNYFEVSLAALFINVFSLVSPLFVMNVYDRVVPNNAILTLWVLSIGVLIIFTFDSLLRVLRGYLIDVCGKKADTLMASALFAQIMDMQLINKPRSIGAFVNNLREFESVRDFFTSATFVTLIDFPFLILFLLLIWYVGGLIVLVPLISIPLIVIIALILERPMRAIVQQNLQGLAQKNAILVESISGLETVKTLVAEGMLLRKWEQQVGQNNKLTLKSKYLSSLITNLSYYIQQISYVGTIIVGVYLIEQQQMTMGALIACSILAGKTLAPLGQLTSLIARYHQAKEALHGLNAMMSLSTEHSTNKRFIHHDQLSGDIELENVSFQYPMQSGFALNDVSLKIKAGERIGIMGRMGSGKTTLEKLILNLYHPQKGMIYFDGIDSKQIDPVNIRHNIGYVPQDNLLFSGTLRDNILMAQPWATDEAMLKVAQIAGLDKVINKHPLGFNMPVGEKGDTFSGGQKQSVTIARALLSNPSIILLDEPTSSMDAPSEAELITNLKEALQDKTLLLVTHRPSLLALVDRVIVMDLGKIIMDGPRDDIVKKLSTPSSSEKTPNPPKPLSPSSTGGRWA